MAMKVLRDVFRRLVLGKPKEQARSSSKVWDEERAEQLRRIHARLVRKRDATGRARSSSR